MQASVLPLENKIVLITGASRGIGSALAETLALAGNVILDTRNLLDPALMEAAGFHYLGIGRGLP